MSRAHASAEERFRCLYAEHVDPTLGFAMRRADQADDAADIVAETFLVALATDRRGAEPELIASSAGPGTVDGRGSAVAADHPDREGPGEAAAGDLHERGVSWQATKTWKASTDPEFTTKMRRILGTGEVSLPS